MIGRKFYILFPLVSGSSGGGNQFLKALKGSFEARKILSPVLSQADVVLFNSLPFGSIFITSFKLLLVKIFYPHIIILHRVDGPISLSRSSFNDLLNDKLIIELCNIFSDGIIYQSKWSMQRCLDLGFNIKHPFAIIGNAPNPNIFSETVNKNTKSRKQIRIVTTSWSSNWKKGFHTLRFLDQNLDTDFFDLSFIGNAPCTFNKIKLIPAMSSEKLGKTLQHYDLFLAPSHDDPCSNSLIEAIASGLTPLARSSGGHPEIVNNTDFIFKSDFDLLSKLSIFASKRPIYRNQLPTLEQITEKYISFSDSLYKHSYSPRFFNSMVSIYRFFWSLFRYYFFKLLLRRSFFQRLFASFYPRLLIGFKSASLSHFSSFSYDDAKEWVVHVLDKIPLFMDLMRHEDSDSLFKYSLSGDLSKSPRLASSVFAAKIFYMMGIQDHQQSKELRDHIKSYQDQFGNIFDPFTLNKSFTRRALLSIYNFNFEMMKTDKTIRAETRQAYAALLCLGESIPAESLGFFDNTVDVENYIFSLDWSNPWDAASHISHLIFFLKVTNDTSTFNLKAKKVFGMINQSFLNEDGCWYLKGSKVKITTKINGAMKLVTAFDLLDDYSYINAEPLIDTCLSSLNEGHACNHFNIICVLHACSKITSYRKDDICNYMIHRLYKLSLHYWEPYGGFSFYPSSSNSYYYNSHISSGKNEPDIHGTVLILWGIVLISQTLDFSLPHKLRQPFV